MYDSSIAHTYSPHLCCSVSLWVAETSDPHTAAACSRWLARSSTYLPEAHVYAPARRAATTTTELTTKVGACIPPRHRDGPRGQRYRGTRSPNAPTAVRIGVSRPESGPPMNVTTTPPRIANDGTDGIVEDVDARAITAPRTGLLTAPTSRKVFVASRV